MRWVCPCRSSASRFGSFPSPLPTPHGYGDDIAAASRHAPPSAGALVNCRRPIDRAIAKKRNLAPAAPFLAEELLCNPGRILVRTELLSCKRLTVPVLDINHVAADPIFAFDNLARIAGSRSSGLYTDRVPVCW